LRRAPVEKTNPIQFDIVNISYTDQSLSFIDSVHCEFEGYRLHESVIAAFLDSGPGQKGDDSISRCIDDNRSFQCELALGRR
jgi:hypothetical protein